MKLGEIAKHCSDLGGANLWAGYKLQGGGANAQIRTRQDWPYTVLNKKK